MSKQVTVPPLESEPHGQIESADELMAVAHAMEREAGRRYRELAERMRSQGEERLASLFTFLSDIEAKHADQVAQRSQAIIGGPPDQDRVRWELPENFDEEAARSFAITPYRALAIAVRNEDRTFAFFSYLAAHCTDDRLRRIAEDLAKDELDHAGLLRRERRKAWRDEGRPISALTAADNPATLQELFHQAVMMEQAAAIGHRALAASLEAGGDVRTAELFAVAAGDEEACSAAAAARVASPPAAAGATTVPRSVADGLRTLESVFERYSDIAEQASDEAVMREAQNLAERALRRLAQIQGSMGRLPDDPRH